MTCDLCPKNAVYNLETGSCSFCRKGYIADKVFNTCTICPTGHIAIINDNKCEPCPTNQEPDPQQISCSECPVGYVKSGITGICILYNVTPPECPEPLNEILINNFCVKCPKDQYKYVHPSSKEESCVSGCSSSSYLVEDKLCQNCSVIDVVNASWLDNCKVTCIGNDKWDYQTNTCIPCDAGEIFIKNGICVSDCGTSFFPNDYGVCSTCDITSIYRYYDPITKSCVQHCPLGYQYNSYTQICDQCLELCPYGECIEGKCNVQVDNDKLNEVTQHFITNINDNELEEIKEEQLILLTTAMRNDVTVAKDFFTSLAEADSNNVVSETPAVQIVDDVLEQANNLSEEEYTTEVVAPLTDYLFRRMQELIDQGGNCDESANVDCNASTVDFTETTQRLRTLDQMVDANEEEAYANIKEKQEGVKYVRVPVYREIYDYDSAPSFINDDCEKELIKITDNVVRMKVEIPTKNLNVTNVNGTNNTEVCNSNSTDPSSSSAQNLTINTGNETIVIPYEDVIFSREAFYRYSDGDTKKVFDILRICPLKSKMITSYRINKNVLGKETLKRLLYIQEKGVNPNNRQSEFFSDSCIPLVNETHNTDVDFSSRRNILTPKVEFFCGEDCIMTRIFENSNTVPTNETSTSVQNSTTDRTKKSDTDMIKIMCECSYLTNKLI
eukprot:CAMPEP_0170538764 /NCGR_PEP_ID=MMETSP0209-20121228/103508_1 /TAXON_ID=665100 ORGANISM="Litonotus pictus, Strain P1" /NCGR_SAMPLE_ID=MMETSP0209 /ASSEMBLY_ACC=CAM_ASM_000301 /LENGTH=669 /DNA_ID=CAMNT_0010840529 /DNA_START=6451 /DNA_END=8464 /DNA_ORIENTATION=-